MTLHIAVDGADNGRVVMKLYEHYTSKGYKVTVFNKKECEEIIWDFDTYTLTNHETALLRTLDECLINTNNNLEEYDIVLWINSIITDYLTLTDDKVTPYWLKQINKFTVKKDLYCYIKPTKKDIQLNPLHNIKNMIIINDSGDIESNLNNLIVKINEYFPHCHWCNHIYKTSYKQKKYCSETCRKLSLQKQTRDKVNRYNRRYKKSNCSNYHSNLGSEALLKQHANKDFTKEHKNIMNEKKRLGV